MDNQNKNNILFWLMVLSGIVYILKVLNDDEISKGKSKYYLARRSITGSIGSALFVWWSYELLKFYQLPESFCLATAGAVGYLGADILSRYIEKFIEKFINKP